jgi:outer membrane biosynthesis protein TonB
MSEVLIVLNLRRRSGVLAAAVAAVHRAGLEFQSQRTVDADGAIQLNLRTEGSVESLDRIVETLGAVSGVNEVADVLVDGVSLMHVPVEPEPEIEPTSDLDALSDETEAVLQDEVFIMPEAVMATEPELEPEPEPKPELKPELKPEPKPEPKPMAEAEFASAPVDGGSGSGQPADDPGHESESDANSPALTPAMLRRRRRRR